MALFQRWIIELETGAPGAARWTIVGSVVGSRSAEAALLKARESIPGIPAAGHLRATDWHAARPDQQEFASEHDEIAGRAIGGAHSPVRAAVGAVRMIVKLGLFALVAFLVLRWCSA